MPLISLGRHALEHAAHIGVESGRRNLLRPHLPRIVGRELGAEPRHDLRVKLQGGVGESEAKGGRAGRAEIALSANVPELDELGEHPLGRADVVGQRGVRGDLLRARASSPDRAKKSLVVFGLAETSFLVDERFDLHPDLPAR